MHLFFTKLIFSEILGQENSARLDSEYAPKGTIDNLYASIGVIFFFN